MPTWTLGRQNGGLAGSDASYDMVVTQLRVIHGVCAVAEASWCLCGTDEPYFHQKLKFSTRSKIFRHLKVLGNPFRWFKHDKN